MTDHLLDDLEEVRRLVVRPGDVLVFRFKRALSADVAEAISARLRARLGLGGDVKILVLDQDASLDVLEGEKPG